MKKCIEVMTKDPVCCLPNDTVDRAAQMMKVEGVGPVPVIENQQSKKLIGIVTDRDLALKIVAEGRDAKRTKVSEVMTSNVVMCQADDFLPKALDAMSQYHLRRIPIVNQDDQIVGIIAQADVATRLQAPDKTAEIVKHISEASATQ